MKWSAWNGQLEKFFSRLWNRNLFWTLGVWKCFFFFNQDLFIWSQKQTILSMCVFIGRLEITIPRWLSVRVEHGLDSSNLSHFTHPRCFVRCVFRTIEQCKPKCLKIAGWQCPLAKQYKVYDTAVEIPLCAGVNVTVLPWQDHGPFQHLIPH